MTDRRISELPNLGPAMERWLAEVGVRGEAELRALGSVEAYRRLKFAFGQQVNRNALHAMEAALTGMRWTDLTPEIKARLSADLGDPAPGTPRPRGRARRGGAGRSGERP